MDIGKRRIEAYKAAQGKKAIPEKKAGKRVPEKNSGETTSGTPGQNRPAASEQSLIKIGKGEKGYRKAAELILLLGRDEGAEVLKHLTQEEVEGITREIASIESLDIREASRILEDFGRLNESPSGRTVAGGSEVAREILLKAFGEETAQRVLKNSIKNGERPFAFLSDLDLHQIMLILRGEPVSVLSVVLALSEPEQSAAILKALSEGMQKEIVRRLSKMRKVDPSVIVKIEEALREKIRNTGKVVTEKVNGKSALVEILRHIDSQSEQRILNDMKERNPVLFEEVSELLFSPEIILRVESVGLESALRDLSDEDIALFLKGKSEAVRTKVLENISERRRAFVIDEYKHLGAVKRSEVDDITKSFLERFRKLYEDGALVIFDEGDSYIQ